MSGETATLILLDNGSLRPAATLGLRVLAAELSARLGAKVHPVSLLHSSKVDAAELGGVGAQTLVPFLREQRALGSHRFVVLPLFFGPSGALVDYLPQRVRDLQNEGWSELVVEVAGCLVDPSGEDCSVAEILASLVRDVIAQRGWQRPSVTMVDHGTPSVAVNAVRNLVASQLQRLLGEEVTECRACSMERREGAEYDFNEPLLERLLGSKGFRERVVVAMLFVGAGRHAGPEGDVAQICEKAREDCPQLELVMTELLGAKPAAVVDILERRYRKMLGAARG